MSAVSSFSPSVLHDRETMICVCIVAFTFFMLN